MIQTSEPATMLKKKAIIPIVPGRNGGFGVS
jgi:hypothetical protein